MDKNVAMGFTCRKKTQSHISILWGSGGKFINLDVRLLDAWKKQEPAPQTVIFNGDLLW